MSSSRGLFQTISFAIQNHLQTKLYADNYIKAVVYAGQGHYSAEYKLYAVLTLTLKVKTITNVSNTTKRKLFLFSNHFIEPLCTHFPFSVKYQLTITNRTVNRH